MEHSDAKQNISISGHIQKRLLEAVLLLRALNEVQRVPTAHGLDICECVSAHRLSLLKRKFLDSFALICSIHQGGKYVSAACMEEDQPEGTILRLACNGGIGDSVLHHAREIIEMLKKFTIGDSIDGHFAYPPVYQRFRTTPHTLEPFTPGGRKKILKDVHMSPSPHLDAFFEWMDGIFAVGESDYADEETLIRLIRHAQRAKHDYAELLNAAFSTDSGQLEKWILIILKIGRYGIASRAFAELALEQPTLFDRMTVHTLVPPPRISVQHICADLDLALRRIDNSQREHYIDRLSQIWSGKGNPNSYFGRQCPTDLTVHAELQLLSFYDDNRHRMPHFRFIGVSKKSCYLCDRFLANHPLSFTTFACHQKVYPGKHNYSTICINP